MLRHAFFLLFRLQDLEILARKINTECDSHSPVVDRLEEKVAELEAASTNMDPSKAGLIATTLTHEIQVS